MQTTWLCIAKWHLTSARTSVTGTLQKETSQAKLSSLFPHAHNENQENPTFRLWPSHFRKEVHILVSTFFFFLQKQGGTKKDGAPSFQKHTMLNCITFFKGNWPADTTHKGPAAHSPSFLETIFILSLSRPVHTEKKALLLWHNSTRELLWHSEHKERGESRDSKLRLHASRISCTKGPLTSGNLMPPAQPPKNKRSLHLTNSAQRLRWWDYRHCARKTPQMKHPHFFTLHSPRRSKPDSLGSRTPTFLPVQEKNPCPTEGHFSSAVMCRPIKAHALTVSAEKHGPNSTNSPGTIGSFFKRKKKAHHAAHTSLNAVRKCTLSHGSK